MGLDEVLGAVRDGWRWIVGGVLVGLLLAITLTWTAEPRYSSTSQLFVSVAGTPTETALLDADTFAQQRIGSYVRVLTGPELDQRVIDDLQLPMTAAALSGMISVTPLPGTVILQVEVTDSSAARAQAIGVSLQRQFTARVDELEATDGTPPAVRIKTLQAPDLDPTPVSPGVRRNLMLGVAFGLILGLCAALLRGRVDTSIRRTDEVSRIAGAELLGRVPEDRSPVAAHVSPDADGESFTAEAYRAIGVNLHHVDGQRNPQVVVVTSANAGEGASTVAVNLAVSLARSGSRVLLVDGNIRRPRVARYLGLQESGPGLTDVLDGSADLQDATRPWDDGRLSVLTAGSLPLHAGAGLDSRRLSMLLGSVRSTYDLVLIDTPPLLPVIDAAAVGALADGCVVVTRHGATRRADLAEAAVVLERVHARLLGVVLNRIPRTRRAARLPWRRQTAGRGVPYAADPDLAVARRPRMDGRSGTQGVGEVPSPRTTAGEPV